MNWMMTICAESLYIIENFLIVFGCCAILEYKGKRIKLSIIMQVLAVYFFQKISTPISFFFTGDIMLSLPLNILMMFGISIIFYKGSFGKKIFAISMYLVPALTAEVLVQPLIYDIIMRIEGKETGYQIVYSVPEYRYLAIILCGQFILILWVLMLLFWKIFMENRWIKEYLLFIIIPIYQFIIFMVYYYSCETIDAKSILTGWFIYMFGIVIDVASLYLISGMLKRIRMEKELSELYQKRKEELDYYMQINGHMENVRELRHEFANQLQVIYGLMEEKDTAKVRRMLDAIYQNMEHTFIDMEKGEKV